MKKDRFDFSEEIDQVDRSICTARRQETEHDALEKNLKALRELNGRITKLTGTFRESVETFNKAINELRRQSQALFSDKTKEEIAQEGERACKRMVDALERKGSELIARIEKKDKHQTRSATIQSQPHRYILRQSILQRLIRQMSLSSRIYSLI